MDFYGQEEAELDQKVLDELTVAWESGEAVDPFVFLTHMSDLLESARREKELKDDLEAERRQHAHTSTFLRQSDLGRHEIVQAYQRLARAFVRLRTEAYPRDSDAPSWLEIPEAEAVSEGRALVPGTLNNESRWIEIRRTSASGKMLCVCAICGRTSQTADKRCPRPMHGRDGREYFCDDIASGVEAPGVGILRWKDEGFLAPGPELLALGEKARKDKP